MPFMSERAGAGLVLATVPYPTKRDLVMDEDRSQGTAKKIKGSIKEAVGKATGNERMAAEGKAEKTGGKVQHGIGKAKDKTRDTLN